MLATAMPCVSCADKSRGHVATAKKTALATASFITPTIAFMNDSDVLQSYRVLPLSLLPPAAERRHRHPLQQNFIIVLIVSRGNRGSGTIPIDVSETHSLRSYA